jgi:hypothetical protein
LKLTKKYNHINQKIYLFVETRVELWVSCKVFSCSVRACKAPFSNICLSTELTKWNLCLLALQPPLDPGPIFSFMIILQTAGLLGRVISSSQVLYLNTGQHKHRIKHAKYPCLVWDSNPRSRLPNERKQFML